MCAMIEKVRMFWRSTIEVRVNIGLRRTVYQHQGDSRRLQQRQQTPQRAQFQLELQCSELLKLMSYVIMDALIVMSERSDAADKLDRLSQVSSGAQRIRPGKARRYSP